MHPDGKRHRPKRIDSVLGARTFAKRTVPLKRLRAELPCTPPCARNNLAKTRQLRQRNNGGARWHWSKIDASLPHSSPRP